MKVRNSVLALAGSILAHAVLAAAIVLYVECAPRPTVSAELDLSSVELSFAEEVAETAPVAESPVPPDRHEVLPPKPAELPPPPNQVKRLPPDPTAPRLREPEETPRQMTPPPVSPPSAQAAPRQAKIEAPPRPVRTIRPEYPKGARQRGEQGDVVLEIEVGSDGSCTDVRVVGSSGFAELDEAAAKAARSARFEPARADGRAVASTARLQLTFRLK